jgi:DNA-binding NarL/FixJ family response regulator
VRVVLADDSVLFREGLARVLIERGVEVVAQVADGEALLERVVESEPDLAIVDIRMPPTNTNEGLIAALQIRAARPDVGVLVLSQYIETHHAVKLVGDGAGRVGYLLKDRVSDLDEFVATVRRVAAGGTAIDPEVVSHLVGQQRGRNALDELSDREREVLSLMAQGLSNHAITEKLFLSPKTVDTHVGNIFTKLGLLRAPDDHRRVLAVLAFLRS